VSDSVPGPTGGGSRARRVLLQGLVFAGIVLLFSGSIPFRVFFAPAAERTLYFKLPLEGVRFHWTFLDPEAFLSGELTLRILNKDRDQTLVVFRDGEVHDGWEMIGDALPDSSFYFGFATTHRVRTRADDSLVITLKATNDLLGRGPYSEGVLAAGVWQMTGTYSSLYGGRWNPIDLLVLRGDPPIAFLQCWRGGWPLTITEAEGWMGAKPEGEDGLFRRLRKPRGTNGRACGSHIQSARSASTGPAAEAQRVRPARELNLRGSSPEPVLRRRATEAGTTVVSSIHPEAAI
jgi:hypothetical protein